MAKRFTDNEKWKKAFFKGLSTVNKLFFLYILDDCSHAGIWHVEKEIAEIRIGESIDLNLLSKELGKHVVEIDSGEKWFIPSFLEFQYGHLNEKVNAHKSVIGILKKKKLYKKYQQFMNCCSGVKDKDMDMDKDMDKDKDNEWRKNFDEYLKTETDAFKILLTDQEFKNGIKKSHPKIDVIGTLEKAHYSYWSTEAGWEKKKEGRKEINWKSTFRNACSQSWNQVEKMGEINYVNS